MSLNIEENKPKPSNFIEDIVTQDIANDNGNVRIHTRFPPEPNGYLHIGHGKAICIDYGIAQKYNGLFNLRFDDTNPSKEEEEFVQSIIEDVKWLGADWEDRLFFASDYFDKLYDFAVDLIKQGKAYICDLSQQEMREYRGTLKEPGKNSPFRDRSLKENLDLFQRMKNGEFEEGSRVLRAKIDMSSPNLNMRDPVLYRIIKKPHHRTGTEWFIYPMYDYAHPLSDALEGITHSICTLEYEDHRPLYDWILDQFPWDTRPKQIEFARLDLTNTVMSKRKLKQLVDEKHVEAWDDPRMPTLSGLRRRGYTPEAIIDFCDRIGVAKSNSKVDIALLEHCIREDLIAKVPRVMAVLRPLKVVILNYPEDKFEELEAENNSDNPDLGSRKMIFGRELYIEQEDFCENPPKKFFRLTPGQEVRLKHAYIIKCESAIKDANGNVLEVHCTYDPETKSGGPNSAKKVKGTIHWVSANESLEATFKIYDHLLLETKDEDTEDESDDFKNRINPNSLEVINGYVEAGFKTLKSVSRFQFIRQGYFSLDKESIGDKLILNRIVSLKDSWAKINKTAE
jgi:glutaminyl-tRNA synthetase